MRKTTALLLLLASLAGCRRDPLWMQSESISLDRLASFHAETADPCKHCPDIGQMLVTRWCLPLNTCMEGYFLFFVIRFASQEEQVLCVPIHELRGCHTYRLLNEDYTRFCGLQSFQAQLVCDGCVVAYWQHQLWTDLIEFSIADEPHWKAEDETFEGLSY